MICDYDLYYHLLKECDPDRYFELAREELISQIREYDEELAEEVESWVDCSSSFLKKYMKFASGCMTDSELYKFYSEVLSMIDTGIEAREYQKSLVDDQLIEADELYANELISDDEYEEIKYVAEEVKEHLDRDIVKLKEIKEFCLKASDKLEVMLCIEKVANTVHSRGSMLPVMCGAYLPEDIVAHVTGVEEEHEFVRPEDVGFELSKSVESVMDCIKEFK